MRALRVTCGVAVFLSTIHLAHGIHHVWSHPAAEEMHNPVFWGGVVLAVIVGILSLMGGWLLMRRN